LDIRSILTNVVPILTMIGWALAAYIVLLWAASVLWTYRDIHARSDDVVVQVLAVSLALLLPFAGVLLHMILRPRQTLTEKYERSLEEEYLRRDLEEKFVCPHCQRGIEPDFVMCPHCAAPPLWRMRSRGRSDVGGLPLLRRRWLDQLAAPELPPPART
jgi:hypothetical protein